MTSTIPEVRTKARTFFAFAFAWSILFWLITIAVGGINKTPGSFLQYFGGAGPVVAALVLIHLFERSEVRRDFWSRLFNVRRIPWKWAFELIGLTIVATLILALTGANLGRDRGLQSRTRAKET